MEESIKKYLESIKSTQVINERVEYLKKYGEDFYGKVFPCVYISTDFDDNQHQYKSLFLISSEFVVEFKDFLSKIDIDITSIKGKIYYFDMIDSREKDQKIKASFSVKFNLSCTFFAYDTNCDYLIDMIKTYVLPNLN